MSAILRGPYTIAPDKAWTDAAATWPVVVVSRETIPDELGPDGLIIAQDEGRLELTEPVTQLHVCCDVCPARPSVLCIAPGTGEPYQFTTTAQLAGILSHLRRSHPDVVTS